MKRRDFIKTVGATGAVGTMALATPALSQGIKEINMVTAWPENFPGLGTAAARLGERITRMSGGALKVNVHGRGKFVSSPDLLKAVSDGKADMYHGIDYYWQQHSRAFNFFASVPFGLTASEQQAWINFGGGQKLWDELGRSFGVKPFMVGNTGMQMGGWFNKQVDTLADMQGLKIRLPGFGGLVLEKIGATRVSLPINKIFPAMRSGELDAAEWFGPWLDMNFGLHKIARFYYYPGFHEPGTTLSSAINLKLWESLSNEHQEIIKTAASAETGEVLSEFNAKNIEALDTLRRKHNLNLRRFSDELMNAIGSASGEVVQEVASADELTGRVFKSFLDFRTKSITWSKVSEQAYWNSRLLPFSYAR